MNHYTRWLYEPAPLYGKARQPFFVVSIYERSGPKYTKHRTGGPAGQSVELKKAGR